MLLEERVGQATTEAEAVRFALELYGLDVAAKALPGEYDDNFHLTTRDREVCADGRSNIRDVHRCSGGAARLWSADFA